jgi:hypothetical protein
VLFRRRPDSEIKAEKPLRYEAMTGLRGEQLTELVSRVYAARGGEFVSRGRPYALGLFGSVALVVCLMRTNITQAFAGAIFGVSQATVSRRWDLLRPVIAQVLAEFVPELDQVVGQATVLVDGTVCPTWDWRHIPDLFSAKAGYPGMNIQIAATLGGDWSRSARSRCMGPGMTPTPSPPLSSKPCSPSCRPWPTWAMSESRASISSRSNERPEQISAPAKPSSTPR